MKGGPPIPKVKSYTQTVSFEPVSPVSGNCNLFFTADLINIQPALGSVPTNNYLSLDAVSGGLIAAYDATGQLCGLLDSPHNSDLLQCLSFGNKYKGRLRHDRSSVDVQKTR